MQLLLQQMYALQQKRSSRESVLAKVETILRGLGRASSLHLLNQLFLNTTASAHPRLASTLDWRQDATTHVDLLHVLVRRDPVAATHVFTLHRQCQVLGHDSVDVDTLDTGRLEVLGEFGELGRVVQLGSEGETAGPGEDGRDGVGRRLLALLVLAVMPRHLHRKPVSDVDLARVQGRV